VATPSPSPQEDFRTLLDKGIDLSLRNDYKAGLTYLLKAKQQQPDDPTLNFYLFITYKSLVTRHTNKSEAYRFAKRVVALSPGTSQAKKALDFIALVDTGVRADGSVPLDSVPGSVVVAPSTPISPGYRRAAMEALDGLRAMDSITTVGISYRDYPSRLQDCAIAVDRFLGSYPNEEIPGLTSIVKETMGMYQDAYSIWDIKFEGDGVEEFIEPSHPTLERVLRKYPALVRELRSRSYALTEYGYDNDTVMSLLWTLAGKNVAKIQSALR